MTSSSPSLTADELHRLRLWLGQTLALTSIGATVLLGGEFLGHSLFALAATLLGLVRPAWPGLVPTWAHRAAFPLLLGAAFLDWSRNPELVPVCLRLGLLLVTYRVWSVRQRREDLQLVGLGLFVLIMTGLLTLSPAFGVALIVFTTLSLALFLSQTLLDHQPSPHTSGQGAARDSIWTLLRRFGRRQSPRALLLWSALSFGVFPLAWVLFLVLPRFEFSRALYLEKLAARRGELGFTDSVEIGQITRLKADGTVAFRFDPTGPLPPLAVLYWRLALLDEYRDAGFRTSAALRAFHYSPRQSAARVYGANPPASGLNGVLYLEPSASRHLPLTGPFVSLDFPAVRDFRHAPQHHLVSLTAPAGSLVAFRIRNMDTTSDLPVAAAPGDPRGDMHATQLGLAAEDRARLDALVSELRQPGDQPGDFMRRASAWLQQRHDYDLSPRLPPGTGDPLVRWMESREPGHCELFAGSLVLLGRAAGIPTRMVAGFLGGTLSGEVVVVRNSDAHAWVEYERQPGQWSRTDPTAAALLALSARTELNPAVTSREEGVWSSLAERVRLAWYRRVIRFDEAEQRKLVEKARTSLPADLGGALHSWRNAPAVWKWAPPLGLGLLLGGVLCWRSRRHRPSASPEQRTRQTAGRWLRRYEALLLDSRGRDLQAELLRIRFGPTQNWPAPDLVLQSAKKHASTLARRGP